MLLILGELINILTRKQNGKFHQTMQEIEGMMEVIGSCIIKEVLELVHSVKKGNI
jgi:hypothetical protein